MLYLRIADDAKIRTGIEGFVEPSFEAARSREEDRRELD
jgi:hypothetical protein